MLRVIITAAAALVLTGVVGYFLIPVLRALKAGQSIREDGPIWHNDKAGTPMMGGPGKQSRPFSESHHAEREDSSRDRVGERHRV